MIKIFKSELGKELYIGTVTSGHPEDFTYRRYGDLFSIDRKNTEITEVEKYSYLRFLDIDGNFFESADLFEQYLISQFFVSGFVDYSEYLMLKSNYDILLNNLEISNLYLGGSVSNSKNQKFSVNLNNTPWKVGDNVKLFNFMFRGDFSSPQEYVEIGSNFESNLKTKIGDFSSRDDLNWKAHSNFPEPEINALIVSISPSLKGINLFISPTPQVNYTVNGMENWWELKCSIKKI